MKQNCKHIHREGDSCSLNNNCKYPECVKVPSAEDILAKNAVEFLEWVSDSNWQFDKVSFKGEHYFSNREEKETKYCDTTRDLYAIFLTEKNKLK